jgi:hypothetical protein
MLHADESHSNHGAVWRQLSFEFNAFQQHAHQAMMLTDSAAELLVNLPLVTSTSPQVEQNKEPPLP